MSPRSPPTTTPCASGCEDELYKFRRDLEDRVLKNVTAKAPLTSVAREVGDYGVGCDYDFIV